LLLFHGERDSFCRPLGNPSGGRRGHSSARPSSARSFFFFSAGCPFPRAGPFPLLGGVSCAAVSPSSLFFCKEKRVFFFSPLFLIAPLVANMDCRVVALRCAPHSDFPDGRHPLLLSVKEGSILHAGAVWFPLSLPFSFCVRSYRTPAQASLLLRISIFSSSLFSARRS